MECNDTPLFDMNDNATLALLDSLAQFALFYQPIHGVICVFLCAFGLLTNAVHIAVLSRPSMRSSAVNCLLTAVAVCDVGTMASYLVYIVHFVILKQGSCSPTYTHGWMQFLLWHVVLSITLHTTSLWLAVAMAFLRRMTLRVARLNSRWQRPEFAWKVTLVIYAAVFVACTPNTLVHEIEEYEYGWQPEQKCIEAGFYPANYSEPVYTFRPSDMVTDNNCRLFKLNIWMICIVFKIIPCILLFFLSIGLMMRLQEAESKRRKLTSCSANGLGTKKAKNTDRTTAMLIVILAVFLITELPQGFIYILTAIYTKDVHEKIYFYLGDILDLMSLLNSSVNFVLYCIMSSRYRKTFWTVVLPAKTYKWFISRANTTSNFAMSHVSRVPSAKARPKTTMAHDYIPLPAVNGNGIANNNSCHARLHHTVSDTVIRPSADPLLLGSPGSSRGEYSTPPWGEGVSPSSSTKGILIEAPKTRTEDDGDVSSSRIVFV